MENGYCMIHNLKKYLFSMVIAYIDVLLGGAIILKYLL